MTRRRFYGLVGFVAVSLDWVLFRFYRWVQTGWEEHFRSSGNLPAWWLLTALLMLVGYSATIALLVILARRYLKVRVVPATASVLIDAAMTIMLWILSTIFDDPLLKKYLVSVGLRLLPSLFFWGGAVWLLIGFARLDL